MTQQGFRHIPRNQVTRLLDELRDTPDLFDRLVPLVYDDLKRIGRAQRRRLGASPTLQTTALVHEAFIKLQGHADLGIENRQHLQRLAACVMRQLILDYVRKQRAVKRGGPEKPETFQDGTIGADPEDLDRIMAIERALDSLAETDPRIAEALAAQLFAGYTVEEIGSMYGVTARTIVRDLRRARAWLQLELAEFRS